MDYKKIDIAVYNLAYDFLLNLRVKGVDKKLLDKYLLHSNELQLPQTIDKVFERLLISAQNANMRAGVIGGSIGGVSNLKKVLFGFNPQKVVKKYGDDWETLLLTIEKKLKPRGKIRKTPKSIWPKYCQTILSSASFCTQFESIDDFYTWVKLFDNDDRARPALPMLIRNEIDGIGFPLACDFLKELGFQNFAKPDVHLKEILKSLNLCSQNASDYQVFKSIIRISQNVGVSPYNVDKLFWLIGSGYFYNDESIGNKGRIGNHKKKFIELAKELLGTN